MAMPPSPGSPTMQGAPPGSQGVQPDDSKYVADGESNVTPEEQAEYDEFVNNALSLMYVDGEQGAKVQPSILEALAVKSGGPTATTATTATNPGQPPAQAPDAPAEQGASPASGPIMALSHTAVQIVGTLDDSARKAGKPVSDDVLMHGGLAVVEELAEIADAAKIYDYTEQDVTGAFQMAIDMYRQKAIDDGRTSEETLKGQFGEINDAEAAGKLGDVLPGLGGQTVGEPPVQQG